jgi:FRG domain
MAKKAPVGAVAGFAELHDRLSSFGEGWIFRGHADAGWRLKPKAGRPPFLGHEQTPFEDWKLRAIEHLPAHIVSDWDWLAIAQHHGLATRLLDWTTNPLNAAYFAVRERRPGPAVIHAARFESPSVSLVQARYAGPLDFDRVAVFRPRGVVPRIVRQGGLFTIHGPPSRSLEDYARKRLATLDRIIIAESYRPRLLAELARYGIHSASLFPDLDGLSSYLNWMVESGENPG